MSYHRGDPQLTVVRDAANVSPSAAFPTTQKAAVFNFASAPTASSATPTGASLCNRICLVTGATVTIPSAASIVAAWPQKPARVGDCISGHFLNTTTATTAFTFPASVTSGAGHATTTTIPEFGTRAYVLRLTNVTAGAEAAVLY